MLIVSVLPVRDPARSTFARGAREKVVGAETDEEQCVAITPFLERREKKERSRRGSSAAHKHPVYAPIPVRWQAHIVQALKPKSGLK